MQSRLFSATLACAVAFGSAADAEVVRFRHVPTDACGNTSIVADASGAVGQRSTWLGGARQPYTCPFRPNYIVTFRHSYTCRDVGVAMLLPDGTPRTEYRRNSVVYNYGSYTIEVQFNPDGSVESIYNAGVGRPALP